MGCIMLKIDKGLDGKIHAYNGYITRSIVNSYDVDVNHVAKCGASTTGKNIKEDWEHEVTCLTCNTITMRELYNKKY